MNVGETIAGRFALYEAVGQGAMGRVFRAEHLTTGRTVAIKCMTSLTCALRRE